MTLNLWYPVMRNLDEGFIEWKKLVISLKVLISVVFKMQGSEVLNLNATIDTPNTIRKRLDRLLYYSLWYDMYIPTNVTHLCRMCSNHASLLIKMNDDTSPTYKYIKFLNI